MSFVPRQLSDGRVCCSNPEHLCDACKAQDATPPNPYDISTPTLRSASHNVRTVSDVRDEVAAFETQYKARRLEELRMEEAEARLLFHEPDAEKMLRSAQVTEQYAPPDPYAPGLEELRVRDLRIAKVREMR
jgi:hypothetical protein